MSTKKAVTGLAAGAGLGASLGSVAGPWGTAIGGAVGGIGGLLYGAFSGDDPDPQQQSAEEQVADIERQRARAKRDAYNQLMLGEASRLGANPTVVAAKQYELGLGNIDNAYDQRVKAAQAGLDQANDNANAIDPAALISLGQTVGRVGQGIYNAGRTKPASPLAELGGLVSDSNSSSPPVQDGISRDLGASLSQGVQDDWDAENLQPLRRGVRMGF